MASGPFRRWSAGGASSAGTSHRRRRPGWPRPRAPSRVRAASSAAIGVGRQRQRPALLDRGVGGHRLDLGLGIGDLGLELEAEHLAPDVGARRCERAGRGGRPAGSSSYSPLIQPSRRLRGFALAARALRRIASASIAVRPGTRRFAVAEQGRAARRADRPRGRRAAAPSTSCSVGRAWTPRSWHRPACRHCNASSSGANHPIGLSGPGPIDRPRRPRHHQHAATAHETCGYSKRSGRLVSAERQRRR